MSSSVDLVTFLVAKMNIQEEQLEEEGVSVAGYSPSGREAVVPGV